MSENHDQKSLEEAARLRQERAERRTEEDDASIWQHLSMIGALGWLFVIPTLGGVLAGRWLDNRFGTGITFTGALIFVGVICGGYLAWRKMGEE